MKNLRLIITLLFINTLFACENASTNQINTKEELINKFMQITSEFKLDKINGKFVILNNEFCESFDCNKFFSNHENEIQFYSREEAFMRGIKNYLEIDKVDTKQWKMVIRKRSSKKTESFEIK